MGGAGGQEEAEAERLGGGVGGGVPAASLSGGGGVEPSVGAREP